MKPKTSDEIEEALLKKSAFDIIGHINEEELDKKYYPSDEAIMKELDDMEIEDRFSTINEYELDKNKFLPSAEIVKGYIVSEINYNVPSGIAVYEKDGKTYIEFKWWDNFSDNFEKGNDFYKDVFCI